MTERASSSAAAAERPPHRYEQILSYVGSMGFLFFGLTATCLFALLAAGVPAYWAWPRRSSRSRALAGGRRA